MLHLKLEISWYPVFLDEIVFIKDENYKSDEIYARN
jgi:hypothetical protein